MMNAAPTLFSRPVPGLAHLRLKKLLVVVSLLVTALAARAQVIFTVTGVAQDTAVGYTAGNSYSFVFAVTSNFINGGGSSYFSDVGMQWYEDFTPADSRLFTSITGDVTGTFGLPTTTPYSTISVGDEGGIGLEAAANDAGGSTMGATGLKSLSGEDIHIFANIRFDSSSIRNALISSLSFSPIQPAAFFLPHVGSHATQSGYYLSLTSPDTMIGGLNSFEITNVTISAIPEPSTYAAIFGGLALAGTMILRRHRRSA